MAPSTAPTAPPPAQAGRASRDLVWLVIGLFFIWGGVTSLNDVLIPKLKGLYALSYTEVMLTQFAFFMGYFIFSLPAGTLIARIGYMRGIVVGLAIMAAGAALFWPSSRAGVYGYYLVALFIIAGGITVLQVAANPLISQLGDERTASSRLTFAQAFNSLGTTIWPYIGANLILGTAAATDPATLHGAALDQFRARESHIVANVYVGIALVLVLLALIFAVRRNAIRADTPDAVGFGAILGLLGRRRIAFGVAALFAYVGAEVSIGSMLVNYLQLPSVLALDPVAAGQRLSLYWGGAMIGRFIGAALLRRVEPGRMLILFSAANVVLIATSMASTGPVAGWALIAVGLFNSIMFPTVFALALEGLDNRAAEGAALLCMAIVGGAIVPLATGRMADATSLGAALVIPLICYVVIAAFGYFEPSRKPAGD
ncbi:sugar MFS transporter [Sphingomonas morindae]|uniref:Sugar MFS transporter n=1 Tax=Sphingomonas morindae TaxID=1541170 RepID=A0ABY4X8E3_9SPHN|nr:sugar MFS transporter [Sphingomonas morindae]USI73110.1 sugar MFS transporter [Sphingomonas morindae]